MKYRLILLTLLLTFSACTSNKKNNLIEWPADLPEKAFFVDDHIKKKGFQPNQAQINQHLTWIKRFYLGSRLAPTGWNKMTNQLLVSLPDTTQQKQVKNKMFNLGKIISTEWAQDNSTRKINTGHISIWGNALRKSIKYNQQTSLIAQIEQDVSGLLNRKITPNLITSERYYIADDYNDF